MGRVAVAGTVECVDAEYEGAVLVCELVDDEEDDGVLECEDAEEDGLDDEEVCELVEDEEDGELECELDELELDEFEDELEDDELDDDELDEGEAAHPGSNATTETPTLSAAASTDLMLVRRPTEHSNFFIATPTPPCG